jgi:hypothetical protein
LSFSSKSSYKEQVQNGFGNINTKFDDLKTRLETLGLHANMNRERKEAHTGDEAHDQPIIELVRTNPRGHYYYEYSSNEEDLFRLTEGINRNRKK